MWIIIVLEEGLDFMGVLLNKGKLCLGVFDFRFIVVRIVVIVSLGVLVLYLIFFRC